MLDSLQGVRILSVRTMPRKKKTDHVYTMSPAFRRVVADAILSREEPDELYLAVVSTEPTADESGNVGLTHLIDVELVMTETAADLFLEAITDWKKARRSKAKHVDR